MMPKKARYAHEIERRALARMKREEEKNPHTPFSHLLGEAQAKSLSPAYKRVTRASKAGGAKPERMTALARRTIANCAQIRGEQLQEGDVEAQIERDKYNRVGLCPETRAIIDRAERRQRKQ